jgi:hypothetical protein
MEQFIGCDAHKKFSVFVAVNEKGHVGEALRVAHDRQLYRDFLSRLPAHSSIAVEASGGYSCLVDEMERAGHHPKSCNLFEAKRRMGPTNKTAWVCGADRRHRECSHPRHSWQLGRDPSNARSSKSRETFKLHWPSAPAGLDIRTCFSNRSIDP